MLNSITGELSFKDTNRLFLKTGGIEWEIISSRISLNELPPLGESVKIFVYLHHRDDQLKLYGFYKAAEKDLFLDLLKVEGVGPKQAVKILSGIEVHHFIEALDTEDIETLSSIPGLGKKTAQKILFKLKGKLSIPASPGISIEEDIVNALAGMGFDRRLSRESVKKSMQTLKQKELSGEELERELFKLAIARLSSGESSK